MRVGLLDADVHGPSVPRLLGLSAAPQPSLDSSNRLVPLRNYGVRALSMGMLIEPAKAALWRGPMVMSAIETLTRRADWGGTDLLLLDMPPGTGDAHLSVAQRLPLVGAVVVTTPSSVAADDAARGAAAWAAAGVPILGVVENMGPAACAACGAEGSVFGEGGAAALAAAGLAAPLLATVPLEAAVRARGDEGAPVVVSAPDSAAAAAFRRAAEAVWAAAREGGPPA